MEEGSNKSISMNICILVELHGQVAFFFANYHPMKIMDGFVINNQLCGMK